MESGQTLAHYTLVEKIGAGGMGEVWKARDTSLDRDVAIKVLPEDFAADPDRLARFDREAKLLASLNHPHIAAIYGLHEQAASAPSAGSPSTSSGSSVEQDSPSTSSGPSGGQAGSVSTGSGRPAEQAARAGHAVRFLAMELVPGANLRARLTEGPLPVDEAIELARQVADALETAHDSGVVHRDVKPENIQVTPDGQAKVLDFGLAKALLPEGLPGSASMSPTITAGTHDGLILGTAAYMSPEQAKGKSVDRRADIWAFGAVLFEMLGGKMLFGAESVTEVLAAVLTTPVDTGRLPAATPPAVKRLLERCLERDPRRRLRDIGEARLVLEDAQSGHAGPAATSDASVPHTGRGVLALSMATSLLVGGILGALVVSNRPQAPRAVRRFPISLESLPGNRAAARISPDGMHIAYTYGPKLWVRSLDRFEPRELVEMEGLSFPCWSPDSRWLAFAQRDRLFKIPLEGGQPVPILRHQSSIQSRSSMSWGEDGNLVFTAGEGSILQVSANGGEVTTLHEPTDQEQYLNDPVHLPGDRGILFVVHRIPSSDITGVGADTLAVFDGRERHVVLQMEGRTLRGPYYSPSGHVLFTVEADESTQIWAVPFSPDSLQATGDPFVVAPSGMQPTASVDGTLVYSSADLFVPRRQLVVLDDQGELVREVGEPQGAMAQPYFSPDGRSIALIVKDDDRFETHVQELDRDGSTRITFGLGFNVPGGWFPDGEELLIVEALGTEQSKISRMRADGTGATPVAEIAGVWTPELSRDGRELVLIVRRGGGQDIWRLSLDGDARPEPFLETPALESAPALSPDGRYLAYVSDESGRNAVYITRYPSGEGRWQVSRAGGIWPRWSSDGDRLYFVRVDQLLVVDVELHPTPRIGKSRTVVSGWNLPQAVRIHEPMPDGSGILIGREQQRPEADDRAPEIYLVENWLSEE